MSNKLARFQETLRYLSSLVYTNNNRQIILTKGQKKRKETVADWEDNLGKYLDLLRNPQRWMRSTTLDASPGACLSVSIICFISACSWHLARYLLGLLSACNSLCFTNCLAWCITCWVSVECTSRVARSHNTKSHNLCLNDKHMYSFSLFAILSLRYIHLRVVKYHRCWILRMGY